MLVNIGGATDHDMLAPYQWGAVDEGTSCETMLQPSARLSGRRILRFLIVVFFVSVSVSLPCILAQSLFLFVFLFLPFISFLFLSFSPSFSVSFSFLLLFLIPLKFSRQPTQLKTAKTPLPPGSPRAKCRKAKLSQVDPPKVRKELRKRKHRKESTSC